MITVDFIAGIVMAWALFLIVIAVIKIYIMRKERWENLEKFKDNLDWEMQCRGIRISDICSAGSWHKKQS